MGLVVLAKQNLGEVGRGRDTVQTYQFSLYDAFEKHFFLQPHRHGGKKRLYSSWRERHVSLQQTLKLNQRFVIKDKVF